MILAVLIASACLAVFGLLKDCVVGRRRQDDSEDTEKLDGIIVDPGNESSAGERDTHLANAAAPEIQSSI
jgi:hypothetical protein